MKTFDEQAAYGLLSTISAHGRALKLTASFKFPYTTNLSTISAHGRALKQVTFGESIKARLTFNNFGSR